MSLPCNDSTESLSFAEPGSTPRLPSNTATGSNDSRAASARGIRLLLGSDAGSLVSFLRELGLVWNLLIEAQPREPSPGQVHAGSPSVAII